MKSKHKHLNFKKISDLMKPLNLKAKKGEIALLTALIGIGITGIIAVFILPIIADSIAGSTNSYPVVNESKSLGYLATSTVTKVSSGLTTPSTPKLVSGSDSIKNISKTLVRNTNYTINYDTGVINITCCDATNGTYNVSYTYYPIDYIPSSGARSVLQVLPMLIALAILIMFVGLVKL